MSATKGGGMNIASSNPINQSSNLVLTILLLLFFVSSCFAQDDRLEWQPPEAIMDSIGVTSGMIIGEAGAGKGYFTIPLAKRVGEEGKIYANDIDEDDLEELSEEAKDEELNNIEIVVGKIEDPLFPAKDLDMIIMVYVLHHLDEPVAFLNNLKKYFKSGAPLVIIERNTNEERKHGHSFMRREDIFEAMEDSDYRLEKMMTFLEKDTIYIYKVGE
jgi:ubiquinone/menaquinone biosynthesis C-methylase UbiE